MRRGLDTDFLVQVAVSGHPRHAAARLKLDELLDAGDVLVLAQQVLAEFIQKRRRICAHPNEGVCARPRAQRYGRQIMGTPM